MINGNIILSITPKPFCELEPHSVSEALMNIMLPARIVFIEQAFNRFTPNKLIAIGKIRTPVEIIMAVTVFFDISEINIIIKTTTMTATRRMQ